MKIMIPIEKKKGHRTAKTEVIHVRFTHRMRSALEIASRIQNQSVSGFIESAVDVYLNGPELDSSVRPLLNPYSKVKPETFSDFLAHLWDPDEVVRFLKLAELAPSLLTNEEDKIWGYLRANNCFKLPNNDGTSVYNVKLIRLLWNDLMEYANTGTFNHDAIKLRLDSFKGSTTIDHENEKLDRFYAAWHALWSEDVP